MDIGEIGDRLAIEQVLVTYVDAVDRKEWDRLDDVFTPDAVIDYSSTGGPGAAGSYERMKPWLESHLAMFSRTQHLLGTTLMTIEGDRAGCRTAFTNPMGYPTNAAGDYDAAGETLTFFTCGGWYRDTCVRTEAGWRIEKKVIEDAFFLR
ncbi:MAG: nuclear transport factor 2 family protein [Actinomycetota bacterium]